MHVHVPMAVFDALADAVEDLVELLVLLPLGRVMEPIDPSCDGHGYGHECGH